MGWAAVTEPTAEGDSRARRLIVGVVVIGVLVALGIVLSRVGTFAASTDATSSATTSGAPTVEQVPVTPTDPTPSTSGTARKATPYPSGAPNPYESGETRGKKDEAQWTPVLVGFARAFTSTPAGTTNQSWREGLNRCTSDPARSCVYPDLDKTLATVAVSSVPQGVYQSHTITALGEDQVLAEITYTVEDGAAWKMSVTLFHSDNGWQVVDYDRGQGE